MSRHLWVVETRYAVDEPWRVALSNGDWGEPCVFLKEKKADEELDELVESFSVPTEALRVVKYTPEQP